MPELRVDRLQKHFSGQSVLDDVSFVIEDGEFFTLLGPSGCGKSTTLNCIAGLERPDSGTIRVGKTTFVDPSAKIFLPPEERNLGVVFQSYALWPHMTVRKNLQVPLQLRSTSREASRRMIDEALEMVGLEKLADRYPHELSGGQQQRVALARALVYRPSVLLLDEPLSNLDAKLREQARAWLKQLQHELGITTVYVTHDQDEALALSDRIAVMASGRMLQVSPPKSVYERPLNAEVAAFIGRCNFVLATYVGSEDDEHVVRLDSGQLVRAERAEDIGLVGGDTCTIAIRPEKLRWALPGAVATSARTTALRGRATTGIYLGARYEYHVQVGAQLLTVESTHERASGDVCVEVDSPNVRLYRGDARPSEVREAQEFAELPA